MKRQRLAATVAATAALTAGALAVERIVFASTHYRGPVTDHFDGERFHNLEFVRREEGSFLKWQATRGRIVWPPWVDAPYGPPPPRRVDGGRLRVTFINHSTTLVQLDGLNILTDPVWSERVSPVGFAGPRRHRAPGIRFEDLPPIDVVLVSHNHYDHMDVATLSRLRAPIFTPLGCGVTLAKFGIPGATELDWWQTTAITPTTRLTLVPSQHFCARALSDRDRNLWGGFVISGPSGNVYFAGDTGWGGHFAQIAQRFRPIRLALLPIGAYLPRWFMKPMHINPAEAVEAHHVLGAETSVAVHFGTFMLSDETFGQPEDDLKTAVAAHGNPRFWILGQGEGRDVP